MCKFKDSKIKCKKLKNIEVYNFNPMDFPRNSQAPSSDARDKKYPVATGIWRKGTQDVSETKPVPCLTIVQNGTKDS